MPELSREEALKDTQIRIETERRKLHEIRKSIEEIRKSIERCEKDFSIFLVKAAASPSDGALSYKGKGRNAAVATVRFAPSFDLNLRRF